MKALTLVLKNFARRKTKSVLNTFGLILAIAVIVSTFTISTAMSAKIGEVAKQALKGMDTVVATTREGVTDAESAQTSIGHIRQSFGEVAAVIEDISSALTEQAVAANELAKNTERVAQMSEENSQAAGALLHMAGELESRAGQVRYAVEVFRV